MDRNVVSPTARLLVFGLLAAAVLFQAFSFRAVYHDWARAGADFINLYTAGKIVGDGIGERLYDYETQKKVQVEAIPETRRANVYTHPAFEALLFVPLGRLSYARAYKCWMLINVMLLVALPALLWKRLRSTGRLLPEVLSLSFFAFFPILVALLQGQDSILLLLIAVLAFRSLAQGDNFRAGCLWGLGLFRFQIVLPLALLFLVRKNVKFLMGLFATGAILSAVSLGVLGRQGTADYAALLYRLNHDPTAQRLWSWGVHPDLMPTLRGFLAVSLSHIVPASYLTGGYLVLSLLIILAVATRGAVRREGSGTLPLLYGLDLLATLAVSYHSYLHDFTLLILPLLFSIDYLLNPDALPRSRKPLAAVVALLLLPPIYLALYLGGPVPLLFLVVLALGVLMWREIPGREARQGE